MLSIALWRLLAIFFLSLAFVGLVLPGIPTTEFVLLAAWASAKGWPRLHNWLVTHPRFGALIEQWQTHRVMPRRAKWIAFASMLLSALLLVSSSAPLWVKYTAPAMMAVVMIWLARRPEMAPMRTCENEK